MQPLPLIVLPPPLPCPVVLPVTAARVGNQVRLDAWGSIEHGGRVVSWLTVEQAKQLATELSRLAR